MWRFPTPKHPHTGVDCKILWNVQKLKSTEAVGSGAQLESDDLAIRKLVRTKTDINNSNRFCSEQSSISRKSTNHSGSINHERWPTKKRIKLSIIFNFVQAFGFHNYTSHSLTSVRYEGIQNKFRVALGLAHDRWAERKKKLEKRSTFG